LPSCGFVGFVVADPANVIAESDETNNTANVALGC
jgi:subtilase family serine protease